MGEDAPCLIRDWHTRAIEIGRGNAEMGGQYYVTEAGEDTAALLSSALVGSSGFTGNINSVT
jgi:hypothetical protein